MAGKRKDTRGPSQGTDTSLLESAARLTGDLAGGAIKEMLKRGEASLRWGSTLLLDSPLLNTLSPERLEAMKQAGLLLRDLRETAGLTRDELSEALEGADSSVLKAVENGTATLSFDLVLRLAALLARNDPLPFIIRFVRTYNPNMEKVMEGVGAAGLSRQIERERRFVNILRKRDDARELSDAQFERILGFADSAVELALDFAAERPPAADAPPGRTAAGRKKTTRKKAPAGRRTRRPG